MGAVVYVSSSDVLTGCFDLGREAVINEMDAIIAEASHTAEADVSGHIDIDKLHDTHTIAPRVLRQLVLYKARVLGYVLHYGGSIPEDGGQVKHWECAYTNLLKHITDGAFDIPLASLLLSNNMARGI